ncbi:MAG: AI-2E family transporter [Acidobacteria bacterium]|nr:AI-2E family transporter [Acidobacteriota bacterium]
MTPTGTDRFGELLFYAVVILMAYLAFTVAQPFLESLAWAGIFALSLDPLRSWLTARTSPTRAALIATLLAGLLIVGPLAALVSVLAREVPQVVALAQRLPEQTTPEQVQLVWDGLRARAPVALPDDPTQLLSQSAQAAVAFLAPRLGGALANIASMLGSLFVMLFALFFLLRDRDHVLDIVHRMLPFPEDERDRLIRDTHNLVVASVGAGLTVAAVQGLVGGVAFWGLGVPAPAAWGVATAVCALIPVVGTTLVWAPVSIWWALSGDLVRALILASVGVGVIGMADNVLRPLILSGRASVNGLVVFIGLLGGVGAFGFVGLILGPIVLVTAGTLLQALTRHSAPREQTAPSE